MQKYLRRLAVILTGLTLLGGSIGSIANAQSNEGAGNGIRISPVRSDLTITPGSTESLTLTVQNTTKANAEFKAIVNDFQAGDDEFGQPALILDDDKFAPSHSLKRYISVIPNVSIKAGQSKDVKVSITMPKDIAAGGYYGAVRFASVGGPNGKSNVSLTASVGSIILVKVPGDIKENVTLDSFDVRTSQQAAAASSFFTSNKDLYAVARFKNTGNVHEQPFGKVVLKKGGKILQTTEINNVDPKSNVLPDSVRRLSVKLDKVGAWGRYTVEGNFGYGTSGQLVSGKSSFFVLPLAYIISGLVLIVLLVLAAVGLPRAIKRYNASVVRRAGRR